MGTPIATEYKYFIGINNINRYVKMMLQMPFYVIVNFLILP